MMLGLSPIPIPRCHLWEVLETMMTKNQQVKWRRCRADILISLHLELYGAGWVLGSG